MPINTRYYFTASMDVSADKEDLFNEVYDTEHVPYLLEVPGVVAVTRVVNEDFQVNIGGTVQSVSLEGEPKYTAIYEIESPDVLISDGWCEAVERGRWATEVRPHTSNRKHALKKVMG